MNLNLNYYKIEDFIVIPGEVVLKKNNEKTFSSIGIRNDFICKTKISIIKEDNN